MNNKVVIIINGSGGVGKDTLCTIASKNFECLNISSVDEVKGIANLFTNWDSSKKESKDRKFLSDLKNLLTEYCDRPFTYMMKRVEEFNKNTSKQILFIHSREIMEINRLKAAIFNKFNIPCFSLVVIQSNTNPVKWGNSSDDDIDAKDYDIVFDNLKINYSTWGSSSEVVENIKELSIYRGIEERFIPVLNFILKEAETYYEKPNSRTTEGIEGNS